MMDQPVWERFREQAEQQKAPPTYHGNESRLDVPTYLAAHGIEIQKESSAPGGGTLYCLRHCVFDPNHSPNEAAIGQQADGKLYYQCFHDSCNGRTWREAREIISGRAKLGKWMSGNGFKPRANPSATENGPAAGGEEKTPGKPVAVGLAEFLSHKFPPRQNLLDPHGCRFKALRWFMHTAGSAKHILRFVLPTQFPQARGFWAGQHQNPQAYCILMARCQGRLCRKGLPRSLRAASREPIEPFQILTPDLQPRGMPKIDTAEGPGSNREPSYSRYQVDHR